MILILQVGGRHGCSFTGFTNTGFDGDAFTVTAGDLNRLVIMVIAMLMPMVVLILILMLILLIMLMVKLVPMCRWVVFEKAVE